MEFPLNCRELTKAKHVSCLTQFRYRSVTRAKCEHTRTTVLALVGSYCSSTANAVHRLHTVTVTWMGLALEQQIVLLFVFL